MRSRSPLLALVLATAAVCAATPGVAQDAPARADLESFRDSIARVRDTTGLVRLETALITRARQARDDALLHLRLGFLAHRIGELGSGRQRYEDAASEFEWTTELQPDWPYGWYGLGLAELALGEHTIIAVENLRQMLGKDYLSKAARAFARAAAADPAFAAAVVDLANTALAQRVQPRLDVALAAVREAAASAAGRVPAVQLARGRVEREIGEADSAVVAFQTALAVGADSGIALLEVARSHYFARRPAEGWRAYFAGAGGARTADAVAAYRGDLAGIATPQELAAFDGLTAPAERAAWLERFWVARDADEARAAGERLAEHYRRWSYARRHFRLVSRHRHYDITEIYRSAQTELDDRGVIYLRHGEPDDRATFACPASIMASRSRAAADSASCAANESWRYRRPEGDLVFHFAARDDVQDYKLVESLVDVLGFSAAVRAAAAPNPLVTDLYTTRDRFGPLYQRVAHGTGNLGSAFATERHDGRRAIGLGTSTDTYRHRFDRPLDVRAGEFVVQRRAAGRPTQDLHVVFAIPAERLTAEPAGGGVRYPLRFRLAVADSAGRPVAALDTMRVFTAPAVLAAGVFLTGRLAVPVPAGRLRYRLLIATADGNVGDVVRVDSVDAAALDGRLVAMSDLVLGRAGAGLVWAPGPDTVLLNPLGHYPRGGSVELYYEVHGLARGAAYRTELTLQRAGGPSLWGRMRGLFGGRRAPVHLAFDAAAEGPVTRVRRTVDLGDLARGAYLLTVRITDPANGTTFVRHRRLEVVAARAS